MDNTMYIVNGIILLTIVRQIRGTKLDLLNLLLPVVTVGGSAAYFLHSVPTDGNDLAFVLGLSGVGIALGVLGGFMLRLTVGPGSTVVAKAGVPAAALMALGSAARMVFAYASNHGYGPQIAEFSRDHMITSQDAWVAALVLMALSEVVTRVAVTRLRGYHLQKSLTRAPGIPAAEASLNHA